MEILQKIALVEFIIYFFLDTISQDLSPLTEEKPKYETYKIKRGDTIGKIIDKFHIQPDEFKRLNPEYFKTQDGYFKNFIKVGDIVRVKEN